MITCKTGSIIKPVLFNLIAMALAALDFSAAHETRNKTKCGSQVYPDNTIFTESKRIMPFFTMTVFVIEKLETFVPTQPMIQLGIIGKSVDFGESIIMHSKRNCVLQEGLSLLFL